MNSEIILWAALFVILTIVEVASPQLVAIWFVAGSAVAFVASLLGAPMWLQVTLFLVTAVILLVFTRPVVKKYLNNRVIPTNSDMNIGKIGTVQIDIVPDTAGGRVSVDGVDWLAVSENGTPIEKGQKVVVKSISGAKLIVAPEN
ncbi:MAG: NfeD family protein [Oscillospiraceae bacterium]